MFDWYQPDPPLRCPSCGSEVETDWQGKDAQNVLFVWQQGHRNPVDQRVDEEIRWSEVEMERFHLPEVFDFYADCPSGHYVVAEGRCTAGVWNSVAEVSAYESLQEYVKETSKRR